VVRKPRMKFKSGWVNVVLLAATIATTILAGSVLWSSVFGDGDIFSPVNLVNGAIYFALPLMLILGIHELAHYYAAKRHGIAASLPFFIPIPPFFVIPIGTMGAFISIREPIPNKKALLDIGASGPIAGLIVAIPVTIVGLMLATPAQLAPGPGVVEGGTTFIGDSVLFFALRLFLPVQENMLIHPTAFAGWVGLFVTALNLLPAGQLDGGHISRALFGDRARYASYGAFALMIGLGLFTPYSGWLIFALLIMILGMRHPPPLNDVTGLDSRRKAIGMATAVVLILCFVPVPFSYEQPVYGVDFGLVMSDGNTTLVHSSTLLVPADEWLNISEELRLENTGNVNGRVQLVVTSTNESLCTVNLTPESSSANVSKSQSVELGLTDMVNMTLNLNIRPNATGNVTVTVAASYYYGDERLDAIDYDLAERVRAHLELRSAP
jgi:membrane-associated protease RseP (regulator of RpoE activity)